MHWAALGSCSRSQSPASIASALIYQEAAHAIIDALETSAKEAVYANGCISKEKIKLPLATHTSSVYAYSYSTVPSLVLEAFDTKISQFIRVP
jgi:hypothetical protein